MQSNNQQLTGIHIGLVSISDRASQGIYQDQGLPALQEWLTSAILNPIVFHQHLIADEQELISQTLAQLVDVAGCSLVITTGGTGPAPRDVTPQATVAIGEKELPGFGEQMRRISQHFVPTAILSRQTAVIRKQALIFNLPGQPKAIKQTLAGAKDAAGNTIVDGIFAAVPCCLDIIKAPYIETNAEVCPAFRPQQTKHLATKS